MRNRSWNGWFGIVGAVVAVVLASAACSGSVSFSVGGESPAEAAVDLIEGDAMAQRLGLDDISDAVCDDPVEEEVGAIFECTATSGGNTIEFDVEIESEDRIFAGPTNVVDGTLLPDYEVSAVQSLNAANGFTLPDDAMNCGERTVVLDADRSMICTITEPETGVVYDAALTISDTQTGDFAVEIIGESAG